MTRNKKRLLAGRSFTLLFFTLVLPHTNFLMRLKLITPKKATRELLKVRPLRSDIDTFKQQLKVLLEKVNVDESEENQKNYIRDFLRETYYKNSNEVNTRGRTDLVIHLGRSHKDKVGVIIEAKRPKNTAEMISADKPNVKALHELVLYYLRERTAIVENIDIKYCVITNVHEWYIIETKYFENLFVRNKNFLKQYHEWENKEKAAADTSMFYNSIVKPYIDQIDDEIQCVYFDIRDYKKELLNSDQSDDRKLVYLYKVLSSQFLLKTSTSDNNTLNSQFYKELLHIIGLEEKKEGSKIVIERKQEGKRDPGSILENALSILQTEDPLARVGNRASYGTSREEQFYNIALELSLTWINRILFLKLLEGQLVNYHQGDQLYKFLNITFIPDFDELYDLFHKVLAVSPENRDAEVAGKYTHIPYLNSSLFDISELEYETMKVSNLSPRATLPLLPNTRIREKASSLPTLQYLFRFLDAYDFGSDSTAEDIQEDNKPLINASVLGKVFEKINGYKDGSIYTPGFITTYMCRQSIRPAVIQKFRDTYGWTVDSIDDVKNHLADRRSTKDILEFNNVINSLHVCDPAVGSGHFLVSALNELIAIKSELRVFADDKGVHFGNYEVNIINDELVVTDEQGDQVTYQVARDGKPLNKEVHRLQKSFFQQKQKVIENCLFGVDININSVKICRLRLWIELLKHAYYRKDEHYEAWTLETLPNIDINIKVGNSLVSRFPLNSDLSETFSSQKFNLDSYQELVTNYRHSKSRREKEELLALINDLKKEYTTTIYKKDPRRKKIAELRGQLELAKNNFNLFGKKLSDKEQKKQLIKLEQALEQRESELVQAEKGVMYKNSFEWRFDFPEVLDEKGAFVGFDIIIGNPPYVQIQKLAEPDKLALENQKYSTYTRTGDLYQLFYEKGVDILKEGGHLCYITSNKWMRTNYGSVTREFLGSKCDTQLVVDFGMAQMFDIATTYTNILQLKKISSAGPIKMCRIKQDYDPTILLEDYVDFASIVIENPGSNSWIAYDKNEYTLIQKIVAQGQPIKEWNIKINYGLKTGFNEAFIIDTETRDRIVQDDPKSAEIIKPILRGEDIKAFTPSWAGKWLINTHNGVKSANIDRVDVERDYPAVYKWLEKFEPILKKRQDKGDHWTNLRNCAYLQEFYKPKIIYPNMTKYMPFVYDKHQFFTNQKCFIITGSHLGYLTAFFNSRLFKFSFKEYFPELLGDTRELSKVFFENVTVKPIDDEMNIRFEGLVDSVRELKNEQRSSIHLELEIENLLAEIYSLSTEEIGLINFSEPLNTPSLASINATSDSVTS